jgi:hypothetical protein
MKKFNSYVVVFAFIALFVSSAQAEAVLADWCFNVNGDSATNCNTGGNAIVSPITGSFDTTLSPTANNLGSAIVSLGSGNGQFVAAYMDYDLNFAATGSFTDFATVLGSAPAGYTYELDDPNSSSIFNDFSANALTNVNNVSTSLTPSDPNGPCCDVSWSLGVGGINVPMGESATVTFTVSATDPGGFRLQEKNQYSGESIYLSATVQIGEGPPPPGVPEPGYTLLVGAGLAGLYLLRRRS